VGLEGGDQLCLVLKSVSILLNLSLQYCLFFKHYPDLCLIHQGILIISNPIIIRARPGLALLTPLASLAPLTAPLPRSAAGVTRDPFFLLLARHDLAPPLLAPFLLMLVVTALLSSSHQLCLKAADLLLGSLALAPQASLPANVTLAPLLLHLVHLRLQLAHIVLMRVLGRLYLLDQCLCLQLLSFQLAMQVLNCLRLDPLQLRLPDGVSGRGCLILLLLSERCL
jgi:hypothetical protein